MTLIRIFTFILLAGTCCGRDAHAESGFGSFQEEAEKFSRAFARESSCADEKTTAGNPAAGYGELYGCIAGAAETAEHFINEDPEQPGEVLNVKVMWNDWYKDAGYGLHPDRNEAGAMVDLAAHFYTPEIPAKIKRAYFGNEDVVVTQGDLMLTYTLRRGPAIDEHLLVVSRN
jgi:hypothetical protein